MQTSNQMSRSFQHHLPLGTYFGNGDDEQSTHVIIKIEKITLQIISMTNKENMQTIVCFFFILETYVTGQQ